MILMKLSAAVLVVAGVVMLEGCTVPATPPGVSVVAGLYPYAYLAEAIGGDLVTVTNLTQPGAEPHDLELTARQVIAVATSDLTIYEAGLQPAVDAAVANATPARALDVTTVVLREGTDPHVWLDPVRMVTLAEAIAQQLTQIDPAHAAAYAAGLEGVTAELHAIDGEYAAGLARCTRRDFITTHAGFGYLAERYGLTQIPIAGISPDAEPSPARIADIQRTAQANNLTTVFFETLASPELARTIAGDLGLTTDVLDPIEGLTSESRGTDYPSLMAANLAALRLANGCS